MQYYKFGIFTLIRGYISFIALDLAYKQFDIAKNDKDLNLIKCIGMFIKFIGMPCKCVIKERLNIN
jgi:hypothetical protein